jgi:hypothetical protein
VAGGGPIPSVPIECEDLFEKEPFLREKCLKNFFE